MYKFVFEPVAQQKQEEAIHMNEHEELSQVQLEIKLAKLELEKVQLEIDKKKLHLEIQDSAFNRFLRKNLAILLTFTGTVLGLVVTLGQLLISHSQENQKLNLEITRVALANKDSFLSTDPVEREYSIRLIEVAFPKRMTTDLIDRILTQADTISTTQPTTSPSTPSTQITTSSTTEATPSSTTQPNSTNSQYKVSYSSIKGVDDDKHKAIIQYLEDEGYQVERADQRDSKPSWFAATPTVLYYDDANRSKAEGIANALKAKTEQTFQIAKGAGRGVSESEKAIYFIIHYPNVL